MPQHGSTTEPPSGSRSPLSLCFLNLFPKQEENSDGTDNLSSNSMRLGEGQLRLTGWTGKKGSETRARRALFNCSSQWAMRQCWAVAVPEYWFPRAVVE